MQEHTTWLTSDKVVDHYEHPRNVGTFDKGDDSVGTGMVGAPACGDVMKLQIKVNPQTGVIEDARFKTYGCGSAIASSSLVTEWVKGKTLDEAAANQEQPNCRRAGAAARQNSLLHLGRRCHQGRRGRLQAKAHRCLTPSPFSAAPTMSVTISEAAAKHVTKYLSRRGKGVGVRLGVKTTGCSGLAYKLEYADDIAPEDVVFEDKGVKVLVDPKSLAVPGRHPARLRARRFERRLQVPQPQRARHVRLW